MSTATLIVLAIPRPANADPSIDMTFRTGVALGTITFTTEDDKSVTATYGGIPLEAIWNRGLSKSLSLRVGGGAVLDLKNMQLIKQGFLTGIAWHLLGGPRSYAQEGTAAGFVTRSRNAITLLAYGGFQNFAATDADNPKTSVSGSVFESSLAMEYHHDFSDKNGVTVELVSSVYSLPASTSRIKTSYYGLIFGWRTFI